MSWLSDFFVLFYSRSPSISFRDSTSSRSEATSFSSVSALFSPALLSSSICSRSSVFSSFSFSIFSFRSPNVCTRLLSIPLISWTMPLRVVLSFSFFTTSMNLFSQLGHVKSPSVSLNRSPVLLGLPTMDHVLVGASSLVSHLGHSDNCNPQY